MEWHPRSDKQPLTQYSVLGRLGFGEVGVWFVFETCKEAVDGFLSVSVVMAVVLYNRLTVCLLPAGIVHLTPCVMH